jgi:hypothetical protein
MSYAMQAPAWAPAVPAYRAYGFGEPRACAANASYNPESDTCNCNVGFVQPHGSDDPTTTPCVASNPSAPCVNPTNFRSPTTGWCDCPPGTSMADPASDNCIPMNLYPGCKDAAGRPVPGCLFGVPTASMVPGAVAGLVVGSLLAWLVFK